MNRIIERELPEGVWKNLLPHALSIIENIKKHGTANPFWIFGGDPRGPTSNKKANLRVGFFILIA